MQAIDSSLSVAGELSGPHRALTQDSLRSAKVTTRDGGTLEFFVFATPDDAADVYEKMRAEGIDATLPTSNARRLRVVR